MHLFTHVSTHTDLKNTLPIVIVQIYRGWNGLKLKACILHILNQPQCNILGKDTLSTKTLETGDKGCKVWSDFKRFHLREQLTYSFQVTLTNKEYISLNPFMQISMPH